MTLAEYQRQAQKTNRLPQDAEGGVDPRLVPLLGLVGEIGTLVAEYKKHLRDGTAYELFETNVEEDLGDILWYLAAAAGQFDLSLQHIAERNLQRQPIGGADPMMQYDKSDRLTIILTLDSRQKSNYPASST